MSSSALNCAKLISVIIAMYNRADAVIAVLNALVLQSDKQFEIILADDGSREEEYEKVRRCDALKILKQRHTIQHVWHPDTGFTLASIRNLGVKASTGNYLLFLDSDCVPETDWVAQHRYLAQAHYFVNGSRILLGKKLTQHFLQKEQVHIAGRSAFFWMFMRLKKEGNKAFPKLRFPDTDLRTHHEFKWRGIRGCNVGVWRADYEAINGFDETFKGWGHEDADFVLRLFHHGVFRKNGFFATEVYHLWHQESLRDRENINGKKVKARMQTHIVRAEVGLDHAQLDRNGVVVTVL